MRNVLLGTAGGRGRLTAGGLALCVAALTGCAASAQSPSAQVGPPERSLASGQHALAVDDAERTYRLHVPVDAPANAPLVLVFHGHQGYAGNIARTSAMNDVADRNGFVVAYPQGTRDAEGKTFFDVGYAFHDQRVDDVGFASALVDHLEQEADINADAVFVTGLSNGADMAYKLACSGEPWVRAIASVAGAMREPFATTCEPAGRISVLSVHGTADPVSRWEGDATNEGGWGVYLSQAQTMRSWVQRYDLERRLVRPEPDLRTASPSRRVTRTEWSTGRDLTAVHLVAIDRGRHVWPGVDASRTVWEFFEEHLPDVS